MGTLKLTVDGLCSQQLQTYVTRTLPWLCWIFIFSRTLCCDVLFSIVESCFGLSAEQRPTMATIVARLEEHLHQATLAAVSPSQGQGQLVQVEHTEMAGTGAT